MINAAEPVDGPSLDAFISTFAPFGLPPNVVVPTYGLAEHTVFVCSGGTTRLTQCWEISITFIYSRLWVPFEHHCPGFQSIMLWFMCTFPLFCLV